MRTVLIGCAAFLVSCAGGSTPPITQTPTGYSGTYGTQVSLVSNACSNVTVQDNPTSVTHTSRLLPRFLAA